jgi:electron transport complex protein RnfB
MAYDQAIYRLLQRHLDKQPVGFPAALSGADLRFLKRVFTPEEAQVALHLSYKPASLAEIIVKAAHQFSATQTEGLLESMFRKGAIGWKEKDKVGRWYLVPVVVGIYEAAQDGEVSPEFMADVDAYLTTYSFGRAFLHVKPSQMRTIPVNKSIPLSHPIAGYEQVRGIVGEAPGPFVVLKCICREKMAMKGKPCVKTKRKETCFAMNSFGAMVLKRGHGREISRDEALELFHQSEADGLVLQPANFEKPEFICSCCGCCCGMLKYQKFLPNPVDFWSNHFQATVDESVCSACGKCVTRCQVNAVTLTNSGGKASVNLQRCIGCGLCATTCPSKAISLQEKPQERILPKDEDALYEEIMRHKKSAWRQWAEFLMTASRIRKPWTRKY